MGVAVSSNGFKLVFFALRSNWVEEGGGAGKSRMREREALFGEGATFSNIF